MNDGADVAASVSWPCTAADASEGEAKAQVQRVLQLNAELKAHYQQAEDHITTVRTSFDRVAAGEYEVPDNEPIVTAVAALPPMPRSKRPLLILATLACTVVAITTGLIVSLKAATPNHSPATEGEPGVISIHLAEPAAAPAQDFGQTIYAARFQAAPPAERMCLARAIYYEARGEGMDGQIAVAQVILNRARSKQWPTTICGVVNQGVERGEKCQFSFACFSRLSEPAGPLWDQAKSVAEEALAGRGWLRELVEATHYHTTSVAPVWRLGLTQVSTIGTHIFYRGNDGVQASMKDAAGYQAAADTQPLQSVPLKAAGTSKPVRAKTAVTENTSAPVAKRSGSQDGGDWKASVFGN